MLYRLLSLTPAAHILKSMKSYKIKHRIGFMQQGQKCICSTKELLFYNWNMVEAAEHEYPCCIKLRHVALL
jgi:hypothetical protein